MSNGPKLPDALRRFRVKYECRFLYGSVEHHWFVIGKLGGVQAHVRPSDRGWITGVEFHSSKPMSDRPFSHADCDCTGGKCWHDGYSSGSEVFAPDDDATRFAPSHSFHCNQWIRLARDYDNHFESDDADVGVTP